MFLNKIRVICRHGTGSGERTPMLLEGYGSPSDIWSFGSLIFELFELGVPYGEEITLTCLGAELVAGWNSPLNHSVCSTSPRYSPLLSLPNNTTSRKVGKQVLSFG